jgi:hypothetical protein
LNVNDFDPKLPPVGNEPIFAPTAYGGRLLARLHELFRGNSLVSRELQSPPVFHVLNESGGGLAIPSGAYTLIPFPTTVDDTHGWWEPASNRYRPRETGYYLFTWSVLWLIDSATPPTAGYQAGLSVNGGNIVRGQIVGRDYSAAAQYISSAGSAIYYMDANPNKTGAQDYAQIKAYQNTGVAEEITQVGIWTYFMGHFIGQKRRNLE